MMGYIMCNGNKYIARHYVPSDYKAFDYESQLQREYGGRITASAALIGTKEYCEEYLKRNPEREGWEVRKYDPCCNCLVNEDGTWIRNFEELKGGKRDVQI